MSATSFWNSFTGFVSKYAGELNGIKGALGTLVNALPLDTQEKSSVTGILDTLENSVASLNAFVSDATAPADLVIKESDIVEALGNFFNSPAGQDAIKNALTLKSSAEGNANG